jgi:hypothetical protein
VHRLNTALIGTAPLDFAMLVSRRIEDDGSFVVASRSVSTSMVPPEPTMQRGSVLPSGFLISPASGGSAVTYILQLTSPQLVVTSPVVQKCFALSLIAAAFQLHDAASGGSELQC